VNSGWRKHSCQEKPRDPEEKALETSKSLLDVVQRG